MSESLTETTTGKPQTVSDFLALLQVATPQTTIGMEVTSLCGWDYEICVTLKSYSACGWIIIPGTFQAASLTGSNYGTWPERDKPRPYLMVQLWRQRRSKQDGDVRADAGIG